MTDRRFHRRRFLKLAGLGATAATLPSVFPVRRVRSEPAADQKFLFVVTGLGGASIIDFCLPVAQSQTTPEIAETHYVYADTEIAQPPGSSLKVVRNLQKPGMRLAGQPFTYDYDPVELIRKHHPDMCVVTVEKPSVNHLVAQTHAITGNRVDGGRTIMEAMAIRHGEGLLLPNVNMASGAYSAPGDREDVPTWARAELFVDPRLYALSTHGYAGLPRAPAPSAIRHRARSTSSGAPRGRFTPE